MSPNDPKDDIANEWFNGLLAKLRFEQDYYIFPGASKEMLDEKGKQIGISIKRPDVRLFSTGIRKLHDMIVDGVEMPDVQYTEAEEKEFDRKMQERFPEAFEDVDLEEEE